MLCVIGMILRLSLCGGGDGICNRGNLNFPVCVECYVLSEENSRLI